MANFLKLNARAEQRIGEYATRLLRIEAHLRRGEKRAAQARLAGFLEELDEYARELEFPMEMTVIGMQLGFFSGKGSVLTGRLPAAIIGGVAGWLFGQSQTTSHHQYLAEIMQRVALLEHALQLDEQRQQEEGEAGAAEESSRSAEPA